VKGIESVYDVDEMLILKVMRQPLGSRQKLSRLRPQRHCRPKLCHLISHALRANRIPTFLLPFLSSPDLPHLQNIIYRSPGQPSGNIGLGRARCANLRQWISSLTWLPNSHSLICIRLSCNVILVRHLPAKDQQCRQPPLVNSGWCTLREKTEKSPDWLNPSQLATPAPTNNTANYGLSVYYRRSITLAHLSPC
jgi:hypothetical protein